LLVATVQGNSGATGTILYDLTDHLGGLNLVEATSGVGQETISYYPFGQIRVDKKASSFASGQKIKYAQTQNDALSGLNYAQARYQNPAQGQFISQDSMFLGNQSQQNLADPQSLNAYSYSEDNPTLKSDPTGRQDAGTYALGGAAILTAPIWTPEAVVGAGLIGIVGASYLGSQGIMQIGSSWYRSNSTRSPGIDPNSLDAGGSGSPNPNAPKWIVGILGGVSTIAIGEKIYQSFNDQIGSNEDGFNITINSVNSLSDQINASNSQLSRSSANTNTRASSQGSNPGQSGSGSGGSGGTAALQLQILQLEAQVLKLQVQVSQSTRSIK
jgi:RHS repeat-associated protein